MCLSSCVGLCNPSNFYGQSVNKIIGRVAPKCNKEESKTGRRILRPAYKLITTHYSLTTTLLPHRRIAVQLAVDEI